MSFVGRGGEKMTWALEHFGFSVVGKVCCDLGSHVGGFVDALLQAGALKVYSVDTCYGTLAWTLRNNERVVVMERTNALHVEIPEKVSLVTCDVGWTKQRLVLPKAASLIGEGHILSLVKPQYEAEKKERVKGTVKEDALERICGEVRQAAEQLGKVRGPERTPFLGGKGKNPEFFMLVGPISL